MKTKISLSGFCLLMIMTGARAGTPSAYYPENYDASRARFLAHAARLQTVYRGVETAAIPVGAENLTVDLAFIPAQSAPRNLVILTSGTHGPEGYAGSALQTLFIEEILPTFDLAHTGVLFVHALNPWGFKHHRRGTEHNVNLNRNFGVTPEHFSTVNAEYDRLREFLEPAKTLRSSHSFPAKDLLIEMIRRRDVTQQSLTEAIGRGQFSSPEGINYGGQDFEEQTTAIQPWLKRWAEPYAAIFHIDLHTGLGKAGVLHFMTKREMNARSQASLKRLVADHPEDRAFFEVTPPEAEGFYEIVGDYANILAKLLPGDERTIIGITAEFGTVGNGLKGKVITINRLIMENQGHFHGYASGKIRSEVERKHLELFYPSSPAWREGLLKNGRYLLDTVVKRFVRENP